MSQFTQVHATKKYRLGTRKRDVAGNEYIYLQGVGSTTAGMWVTYDEAYATALLDTDAVEAGGIAIAMAAVDATTEYGWYGIAGTFDALCLANFADKGIVFATSTAGSVDDADTGIGYISNALGQSARDTTTGMASFQILYPFNTGADTVN